jgi:hypothetical protein
VLEHRDNALGALERSKPGSIQCRGAARSLEQFNAKPFLKPLHLSADGGLRQANPIPRRSKRSKAGNSHKSLKFRNHDS